MFFFRQKSIFYILGALFAAAILTWVAVWQSGNFLVLSQAAGSEDEVKVIFFDIGQGSSVFIETSSGNQVLVDGGPGSQVLNKLGRAMPFFDRSIDILVLTHPDKDHLNGLVDVLKKYRVGLVIESCIADSGSLYQEWLRMIEEKQVTRLCARMGQRIKLSNNAFIDVVYPFGSIEGQVFKNTNQASLVMMMENGSSRVLLTGDADDLVERQLVHFEIDLRAQILQVGHHGSKTSTSEEFVEAVLPEIAVVQSGKDNRYGHPHQEVLTRLKGAKIFRTDMDGDVKFLCHASQCFKK